jgi:hypothetical protein
MSCGMMYFGPATILIGLAWTPLFDSYRWWAIPISIIVFCAVVLFFGVVPDYVEFLMMKFKKCPRCGRRAWTPPYTRGFGL